MTGYIGTLKGMHEHPQMGDSCAMNNIDNGSNEDPQHSKRSAYLSLRDAAAFSAAGALGAIAARLSNDPTVGASVFAAALNALTRK